MYKILIADDEIVEREALETLCGSLFDAQTQILLAKNGKQAVAIAETFYPDIAVLDIKMPVLNGIDAAKSIRNICPDCQIIMLTGFTYFNYAKDSVSLGAIEFLVKPAPDDIVTTALRKAMRLVDKQRSLRVKEKAANANTQKASRYMESELVSSIAFAGINCKNMSSMIYDMYPDVCHGVAAVLNPYKNDGSACDSETVLQCQDICAFAPARQNKNDLYVPTCRRYGRIFLALMSKHAHEKAYYEDFFTKLKSDIEATGITLGVGLGRMTSDLSHMQMSFMEARRTEPVQGKTVWYSATLLNNKIDTQCISEEQLICECLIGKRYSYAMLLFEQLISKIIESHVSVNIRLYELLVVISRYAATKTPIESTVQLLTKLQAQTGLHEKKQFSLQYLQKLTDQLILSETGYNDSWIHDIKHHLKENYQKNITLEEAACKVGFSTYYFSRLFKQHFDQTFVEYLTHMRISKAKQLLTQPGSSVKEVCFSVGYSEPNYFSRVFKRKTGMAPSDYQRSFQIRAQ